MDEPRPSEGSRVLRALRNVVLALLGISVGVLVVGYATGMSFVRGPVDDLVYNVTGLIAKPVPVQGAAASASASSTGHEAANLLDGRLDYWSAPRSKLPITLTFTFNGPIDLTSINLIAHPRDNQVGLPGDVQIVLPDGTTIDKTVADQLSGSADQPSVTFDIHARGITTLKLLVTSVEPATSPQVGIAEVRFYRRP